MIPATAVAETDDDVLAGVAACLAGGAPHPTVTSLAGATVVNASALGHVNVEAARGSLNGGTAVSDRGVFGIVHGFSGTRRDEELGEQEDCVEYPVVASWPYVTGIE